MLSAQCSDVFSYQSQVKLGSGFQCNWESDQLNIDLGSNPTLVIGDQLSIEPYSIEFATYNNSC